MGLNPYSVRNAAYKSSNADVWAILVPIVVICFLIAIALLTPVVIHRYCRSTCIYGGSPACWYASQTCVSCFDAKARRERDIRLGRIEGEAVVVKAPRGPRRPAYAYDIEEVEPMKSARVQYFPQPNYIPPCDIPHRPPIGFTRDRPVRHVTLHEITTRTTQLNK